MSMPDFIKKYVPQDEWNSWSKTQQDFIINHQGMKINAESLSNQKLHNDYTGKTWDFDLARDYIEICDQCKFKYCFYAMPRNWSMGSDSDVWNLMRCANAKCGHYFESCL